MSTLLFHRFVDGLLLRCINKTTTHVMLEKIHGTIEFDMHIGGHFDAKATTYKILRISYYWSSIFKDSYKFV